MAKLTNRKMWMFVHFLGSAAVFALVLSLFWHVDWVAVGGAYTGTIQDGLDVSVRIGAHFAAIVENYPALLPVTSFADFIFAELPSDGEWLLTFTLALDVVVWFNLFLYVVQAVLFIPSWLMGFLESKVKDGSGRF